MGAAHSIGTPCRRSPPRRGSRSGAAVFGLIALLLGLASLSLPDASRADTIYAFTDAKGVTHYTNRPLGDRRFQKVRFRNARRVWRPAPDTATYDTLIDEAARVYRLPPALVKAVIAAESAFDPDAVSRKGAQGLMQLMPQTAADLGVADPLEPASNVHGGAGYLRAMIDRYGDLSRALAAYNAGPSAVDRFGGVPPYRETRDYVDRVLTYYRSYHVDFAR
jgi:soluble lytic murein transglycosylase-like protein